jgi:hypothetical protein
MPNSPRPDAPRVQWCMESPESWSRHGANMEPGRCRHGADMVPRRATVTPAGGRAGCRSAPSPARGRLERPAVMCPIWTRR